KKHFKIALLITFIIVSSIIIYKKVKYNALIENVYDEIYYDEHYAEKRGWGNATRKIKGYRSENFRESRLHEFSANEFYDESSLPDEFKEFRLSYNFNNNVSFLISYVLNDNIIIVLFGEYRISERTLIRHIIFWDANKSDGIPYLSKSTPQAYITEKEEINKYLVEYNISSDDLDSYFNKGMNEIFLKDWFKVYRSRFSFDNLGEYKIVDEW
ncbi:MAG: TipC family immunity protein, partial [Bacilli bacterium]